MQAIRIYTCKTIPKNYIVLTDDGEYRPATPALTRVGGPITQDYIPKRLNGRGAEDITDTPEGRVFLATLNLNLGGEARSPASLFAQSGGRAKSAAKAAASRANGRKGGRPKKAKAETGCQPDGSADDFPDYFPLYLPGDFQRNGDLHPCPKCGHAPVVEKKGDGYVVYCPHCNPKKYGGA